jgi:hypothetical protein
VHNYHRQRHRIGGAINALGYATEEDNVIKVIDNKLANELLEILLTS